MLFSGREVAEKIFTEAKERVASLSVTPGLGVVLVGDDAPSHLYVGIKEKKAKEIGIDVTKIDLPESATTDEVIAAIEQLNKNQNIHGIVV
jgi:methylenetetrahydrofolate dehydrogenase (NADP+) / methenyltetrahydrofolate cyclohydrolase